VYAVPSPEHVVLGRFGKAGTLISKYTNVNRPFHHFIPTEMTLYQNLEKNYSQKGNCAASVLISTFIYL
jgi:hypothetical protein